VNRYEIQNLYNIYCNEYNVPSYYKANSKSEVFMSEVPINDEVGYIVLYLTKDLGKEVATNAVLTIYVRQGNSFHLPVKRIITTQNPTIIELPIAHKLGTLIKGPEYYFTTYDLTIEMEGYYKINTLNIRLFPKIKVDFFYNFNRILQGVITLIEFCKAWIVNSKLNNFFKVIIFKLVWCQISQR